MLFPDLLKLTDSLDFKCVHAEYLFEKKNFLSIKFCSILMKTFFDNVTFKTCGSMIIRHRIPFQNCIVTQSY